MQSIADIRKDYKLMALSEKEVASNPIDQFTNWWNEAINSKIEEVNAMTLATVKLNGMPNARIVLLKGYNEEGFLFFTNYESPKGKEIATFPFATLVFFWKELERQIRIEGTVEKISEEESDTYFQSRPEGSRIGAWASPQSTIIKDREFLEKNVDEFKNRFKNDSIPRPSYWGGYIVKPVLLEFWQGRSNRLHDRIRYQKIKDTGWKIERLAP